MISHVMDQSEEYRTIVVSGVPDILPCSRMADKLIIHFQSSRSHGGDVARIQYPTHYQGVAFVTFEDVRDFERVLHNDQIMQDKEFPREYSLTVFRFSHDVFFFVQAEADLSLFSDPEKLIQSLRTAHRSVRISLVSSKGRVVVEGTFKAVRELREDLIRRAQIGSDWCGRSSPDNSSAVVMKQCLEDSSGDRQENSMWVDTNIVRYIQRFYSDDYDRCLRKYLVGANLDDRGDLTLITLKGKGPSSSVGGAKSELEQLMLSRQSTLRSQQVDYRSSDKFQRDKLVCLCRDLNAIYSNVLLIPLDSCIEVIGPSPYCQLFCQRVEDRRVLLEGSMVPNTREACFLFSEEEGDGTLSASYRDL